MCKKLVFVSLVLALTVPAFADNFGSWAYTRGAGSAWPSGGLVYYTEALDTMLYNENNAGGYASGTEQGLGQMFAPSSDITVKQILLSVAGMVAATYNFEIYDVEEAPGEGRHRPDPWDIATAVSLEWSYSKAVGGVAADSLVSIVLDTPITLYGGEKYALLITATETNPITVIRGVAGTEAGMGITTNGTGGGGNIWKNIRDYGGSPTTDSNNVRQLGMALYTPEPATMVLLGLGSLALLRRRK